MKKNLKVLIIILVIAAIAIFINSLFKKDDKVVEEIKYNFYKYYNGEKFGLIDEKGNVLIDANYQDVILPNPQYGVFFLLENNEIIKVVNEKNEEIFTKYDGVYPIPVTGLIGEIPYEKHLLSYKENDKYGLIDINGKILTKAEYDSIESVPYKEGEVVAKTSNGVFVLKENGKEKIRLNSGTEIIADGYFSDENSNEKSGYIISETTSEGVLYGYVNSKGKEILKPEYDKVERIMNDSNYLIVKKNGKYGLYQNGEAIINCNYQEMKYESSINLYFVRRGNFYGVLDEKGKIIVPVEYQKIENKGVFIVATSKDKTSEYYTLSGEKTDKFSEYNSIEKSKYDNTYIGVSQKYVYKILDSNYNALTTDEYEYIENVMEGLYIVRNSSGKYGVLNAQNKKLIENKYDIIQVINNTEVIQVMDIKNNITSLYDKVGNKIIEEKDIFTMLDNGYIKVFCDEGIKYFTLQGKAVSSSEIYKKNNVIGFYENGKWGFKDKNGNTVVEAKYDRIVEINEKGFGGIKQNDKWGIIDDKGNIVVEPKFYIDDNVSEPEFLNKFYKNYYASVGAFYVE